MAGCIFLHTQISGVGRERKWTRAVGVRSTYAERVTCPCSIDHVSDSGTGVAKASYLSRRYIKEGPLPLLPSATHWDIVDMPATTLDDTAPPGYTTVHGFYRFTDIFYEW